MKTLLTQVLPKPANFDTKDQKSSSSKSPESLNNDKTIGKPADLGLRYDAGRKSAEEAAGPVVQGGEDPDPVTRCVQNHYKSDILTDIFFQGTTREGEVHDEARLGQLCDVCLGQE